MEKNFLELATAQETQTENGDKAYTNTGSYLVDMFYFGVRGASESTWLSRFQKAYSSYPNEALRLLLQTRDVRGGKGERLLFNTAMAYLWKTDKEVAKDMLKLVPEYGYFKDLLEIEDLVSGGEITRVVADIFYRELLSRNKLAAKWAPSEGQRKYSRVYNNLWPYFGSKKAYRKFLSALRSEVVETYMSANKWGEINYEHVPSKAGLLYRNAFIRHDETRYTNYLDNVNAGKAKINAGVLHPVDLVRLYLSNSQISTHLSSSDKKTIDAMWNQLQTQYANTLKDTIVVVDTSGSMYTKNKPQPIEVAISLGLLAASALKGELKGSFITFSEKPKIQKVNVKAPLSYQVAELERAYWDMNTNLLAVFDLILNTAVQNNLKPKEVPSTILIISDMQFDEAMSRSFNKEANSVYETAQKRFNAAGYDLPLVVFWNVGLFSNAPTPAHHNNTILLSGYSPALFEKVATKKYNIKPIEVVLDIIKSPRYDVVDKIVPQKVW